MHPVISTKVDFLEKYLTLMLPSLWQDCIIYGKVPEPLYVM